ncbi:uncharacterized protein LOC126773694 isoform X2 [Nymphalis io]|uniref:uncharacterized protein LOC126773694 isoform X2 n=1 Tax=Inachis io TaxID=171585 RepID=UPI0021697761|nr:uncharacterized protein LOC126773694 isoform X2 [Nymphalis io]
MDSLQFNYNMDEGKPIFTTASDNQATTTTESFAPSDNRSSICQDSGFSPLAAPFQSRVGNELLSMMTQQEPRAADTAPSAAEIDDVLMNLRLNGSDLLFDDVDHNPQNYYIGGRTDPVVSHPNMWSEGSGPTARNGEMVDTFDFLIKSLSSANNYVSMLTREQLSVLRSIRPSLLYEFLQEVAKVRSDKRMRRALPNECAFCKNNGENEESYSSHALKDWRGRVLCPVLRAFRCPRCGATGDRAHTIKYCPENSESGLERSGSLLSRRRMASSGSLVIGAGTRVSGCGAPATPAPSPSPATSLNHSSLWSSFGMN